MRRFLLTAIIVAAPLAGAGVAEAQNFKAACRVAQLCAGVQPGGGRIIACLRQHQSQLSEQCYAAIGRRVINHRGRGRGGGDGGPGRPPPGGGGGPGGPPSGGAGGPPPGGASEPPPGGAGEPPPGGPPPQ